MGSPPNKALQATAKTGPRLSASVVRRFLGGGMRKSFVFVTVALLWSLSAAAQSVKKGQSICYEVQNAVNALVDYTQTSCLPGGGKAGALSFIVVSSKPVFSVEASKKGWLLVAVASVGKTLNEQPLVRIDGLWLSDSNLMKSRVAYCFPASLARSLQRRVYNGQIDLEGMYAAIKKNLVQKTIPKK
jgi:hypothetical protein